MKRLARLAVVFLGFSALPAGEARPEEMLVLDKNPKIVTTSDHGFPTERPTANGDWTVPPYYYQGTLYYRIEFRKMPVPKEMTLQGCFYQYGTLKLESCGGYSRRFTGVTGGDPVIVTWTVDIPSMRHFSDGPIDWTKPRDKAFVVIRTPSGLYVSDYGWLNPGGVLWAGDDPAEWYPMEWRYTVVVVTKGGTFSGWENYIGGGTVTKPGVATRDATNVGLNSARLNGEVTSTGGENPAVIMYWGTSDGGTNSGNWDHTENLGTKGTGTFYKDVSALTAGTTYHFRCFASNSAGGTWASSSKSFTTLAGIGEPTVTTRPASSVRADSARLNGEVTSTGGENPTVKIYWGDNDGGTTAGNWDHEENFGTKPAGTFYKDVTELTEGQTYHFRCFASNSAGGAWASSSESFTATAPVGGLVGHWKFDDGSGTTATDSSAKGNDGTVHGATWTTGKIGGALSFGGADTDYVEIPNESDYDLADAVSYAVWIKASPGYATSWMGVITKGDNMNLQTDSKEDYLIWQTKDHPDTISQYQLKETTNTIDGSWHHIAATFDGSEKCIYVDGKLDNSAAATGYINTTDYQIMIGKNGEYTGNGFDGLVDDVRIYDYALSLSEVQALYAMGSGGGPQDPTITQHPQSVAVTEEEPATFAVSASGTGTLHYQWYEDGRKVGSDSATYVISSTAFSQNGHKFHCLVTDDNGSVQSNSATLTVNPAPVDTDQDGLPDSWEDLYGLDPTKDDTDGDGTPDPDEDLDQDGYTNLEEFQHGTVPTDRNSFPEKTGGTTFCAAVASGARTGGVATALLLAALCARIIRGLFSTRRAAERS